MPKRLGKALRHLTVKQAAELAGVSRPYMAARIAAGDIPVYVREADVLAWRAEFKKRRRQAMVELANMPDVGDDEDFARAELEGPNEPNPGLVRLLAVEPPWETKATLTWPTDPFGPPQDW